MKFFQFLILLIPVTISSCNSDCNDCDSYTSRSFYIENNTDGNYELIFYRDSGEFEMQSIIPASSLKLFQVSVVSQSGFLVMEPFYYDSVQYLKNNTVVSKYYQSGDCSEETNPLCENNFVFQKESVDDNGNKFIEYKIYLK